MKFLLSAILILCSYFGFAQSTDSIPSKYTGFPVAYKQFQYRQGYVYALTTDDNLYAWQIGGDTLRKLVCAKCTALAKDRYGIVFGYKAGLGRAELNGMQAGTPVRGSERGTVYGIFYNRENLPLFATSQGVVYKDVLYKPVDTLRVYEYRRPDVVKPADFYYIDAEDHLWTVYDYGEFGSNSVIFDLNTLEFYGYGSFSEAFEDKKSLRIEKRRHNRLEREMERKKKYAFTPKYKLNFKPRFARSQYGGKRTLLANATLNGNLKGVAENEKGDIITTQSLMHFTLDGSIEVGEKISSETYKFTNLPNLLKYDYGYGLPELLEYVGPVAYNTFDEHFYYYTSEGFFRLSKNIFGKYHKKLLVKPQLSWNSGQTAAIGFRMNVIAFQFISEKSFLFLMESSIGFYDNGTISWYR